MASGPNGGSAFQLVKSEDGTVELDKIKVIDEQGSAFGYGDSVFYGIDGQAALDTGDWEARDLQPFLTKDYKAKQILSVLQLPICSAERTIKPAKGDKGEFDWLSSQWAVDAVDGGCSTPLDYVVDQSLSALAYKRAYFEKVFKRTDDGKIFYDKVAWRPQTTCRLARDVNTGALIGFQQQKYGVSALTSKTDGMWPINISLPRAYIYIHGTRQDPINGISEMEVAYWAYKTKQKIMLLWFQFLEGVALPRIMVGAQDVGDAKKIASSMAGLRNSGILPYGFNGGPNGIKIDVMDSSGKGADQFMAAINFLDVAAVDSVLAGFLNLTGTATRALGNGGSYALSKDASDFFLQSESAITREISASVRGELFAPIVRANFGRNAAVPTYEFEPLNDEDKSNSIALLNSMIAASAQPGSTNPVPTEFVSELSRQVGDYLGLDGDKIAVAFEKAASEAKVAAAAQSAAMASPAGQDVAAMSGATNLASKVTSPHGLAVLKKLGVPA